MTDTLLKEKTEAAPEAQAVPAPEKPVEKAPPKALSKTPAGAGMAAEKPAASGALVPYRSKMPSITTPVGDIDAYIRAAKNAPILSEEEEKELLRRFHEEGDMAAGRDLVYAHLRLVVAIARAYLGYGISHADLIQEGNIGLMKALRNFDEKRGSRLATFAEYWIRSEIQNYIIKNWRQVKLATTKAQRKLFFNLRSMRGDNALTYDKANEIAKELDVKPEEVLEMEERMYGSDVPLEASDTDSDESEDTTDKSPITWLSRPEDNPEFILEEKDDKAMQRKALAQALSSLDERSRRVIAARYFRENEDGQPDPMTLTELAKELGVSAERVRQIEKAALAKMKKTLTADGVEDAVEEEDAQ